MVEAPEIDRVYKVRPEDFGPRAWRLKIAVRSYLLNLFFFAVFYAAVFWAVGKLSPPLRSPWPGLLFCVLLLPATNAIQSYRSSLRSDSYDLEIQRDRLIQKRGANTTLVLPRDVEAVCEGKDWRGLAGLTIRARYHTTIFVPQSLPAYPQVKLAVEGWKSHTTTA